jgi:hypothetical protein
MRHSPDTWLRPSVSTKDPVLVQLRASIAHVRDAIESTPDRDMDQQLEVFGQPLTLRLLWIGHGDPARASRAADGVRSFQRDRAAVEPVTVRFLSPTDRRRRVR